MTILKIFLILFWLLVIPKLMGMFITFFLKEKNIIESYILGYLFCFALFQIIAIPLIIFKFSFNWLIYIYISILLIISIISIILNKDNFKNELIQTYKSVKDVSKILFLSAILIIGIQLFVAFWYTHIDDDDAIYVGTATTTVQTNTMFGYDARDGKEYTYFQKKYALAPFSIYIAFISKVICIHPAIVSHTIMPMILIFISYMVYALIASELFNKNKDDICLFLIILSIVNLWGNYSPKTTQTFLLFRIWQGKSILANIIIPSIWLYFIKSVKNDFNLIYCIILFIVNMAGALVSTLGIGIPEIALMFLAISYGIISKKRINILKNLICCIPGLIYGIFYLVL